VADDFDTITPEQTYVPRAKVRLGIRFEEFGDTGPLKSRVPKKPAKNAKGTSDARAELRVVEDQSVPFNPGAPFARRWVLMPQGGTPTDQKTGSPQEQRSSSDGRTHFIEGIIPREAQWTQNGVRAADTLRFVIKFVDCPIDPRVIRACAVQFYLGTIPVEEHGAQMRDERRGEGATSVGLPDEYVDSNGRARTNLRFEGWVDKWDVDINDESEPTATLECRDNTQVLIDQEAPPALVLDAKIEFPQSVAKYLAHFPQFVGLSIEYRGVGTAPTLESVLAKGTYAPNLGPPPAGAGGASGGAGKLSVWDYLTDAAGALGHLIFLEGTTVVITRARTLYSSTIAPRPTDPFMPRAGVAHRVFIYGRNVLKIGIGRAYNRQAPSNIEVRCYLPAEKRLLVGRFPGKDDFLAMGLPGDGGTDAKWSVHKVSGFRSEAALIAIAKHIYETVGRNELSIKVSTRNLASLGGGNLDPDILDMRAGDPFELLVNRDPTGPTVNQIEQYLVVAQRAAQFLRDIGFDSGFADAYAKAYGDSGFQTVFRTKTIATQWHIDEGVAFDIEGMNYIEVRADSVFGSDDGSADAAASA
jgi:rhodanese-related sulfurtransferase